MRRARDIARKNGLQFAYTGNVFDPEGQITFCPSCGEKVLGRDGYTIEAWNLAVRGGTGACWSCGASVAGHVDERPGTWGSRRARLRIV